ncbi:hypothetical protein FSP39_022840 [Pinctada imbricata]|uniref:G-protein coupled receptors family 1 profile domain-containing protein n=1 Tax=Pinctada imbricata TaxID=66713 RepID=A0AA89BY63_PINIB|nr:hypothetical protein FSP39_022840 [Pinctada imbricata]
MAYNFTDVKNNLTTSDSGLCVHQNIYEWYNCVIDLYASSSVVIDRYITPVWYVIGILGNSLILKVWIRRMKRASVVTSYLTVLAMSDLLLLLLHILVELKFAWNIRTIDAPAWCQVIFVFYMFAQYMSPMLIVGFTLERFISIAMPFKSERFSKRNRAPIEICAITILGIALSIPQIFGWTFKDGNCLGSNSSFFADWTWFSDILVFCILPILSFLLNILVVLFAKRSMNQRKVTAPLSSSHHSKSSFKTNLRVSTITLLCVSFYRIFTVLPVAIIFALQFKIPMGDMSMPVSQMKYDKTWNNYFSYLIAKKIIDEIGLTQYSCNVFIYLATVNHFRRDVLKMFRKWLPSNKRDSMELQSYNSNVSKSTYNSRQGLTFKFTEFSTLP